jgi:uncharacterized protein (TIRG00374 family)
MKYRRAVIRSLLTLAALGWFFTRVRMPFLLDALTQTDWPVVLAAFLFTSLWIIPSVERWRLVASSSAYEIRRRSSFRLYLIAAFFNTFLPTGNGGDIVRGYMAHKEYGYPVGGLWGTIAVERIMGLLVSALLLIVGGLLLNLPQIKAVVYSAILLVIGLVVGWSMFTFVKWQRLVKPLLKNWREHAFVEQARILLRVLQDFRAKPRVVAWGLLLSLLNQLIHVIGSYILASAIHGFAGSVSVFMIVIPLSFISMLLPSIGGYGIREAGFIVFLGWFGVSYELAACFAVLRLFYMWGFAVVGGTVYLIGRKQDHAA